MNNSWERLESVIKSTNLSINKFALSIGLKRAENLYRIKDGKNSISKDLAKMITMKYCNISKAWLLTGEGTMYLDTSGSESEIVSKVPFYTTVPQSMLKHTMDEDEILPAPLFYIDVPTLANCDLAVLCVGESMKPEIPPGSIVTLKEISVSHILPGEIYMVVTDAFSTIKYVRIVEGNKSMFRLVPENKKEYDEALLDKSSIRHIFLVKGVISTKVL